MMMTQTVGIQTQRLQLYQLQARILESVSVRKSPEKLYYC